MPSQGSRSRTTKADLQARVDILGQLLFEAVHLLRTDPYWDDVDEDRTEQVEDFLYKCQKEGMV